MINANEAAGISSGNYLSTISKLSDAILKTLNKRITEATLQGERKICIDFIGYYHTVFLWEVKSPALKNVVSILKAKGYKVSFCMQYITIKW